MDSYWDYQHYYLVDGDAIYSSFLTTLTTFSKLEMFIQIAQINKN